MLYVEVEVRQNQLVRIAVYENDNAHDLTSSF